MKELDSRLGDTDEFPHQVEFEIMDDEIKRLSPDKNNIPISYGVSSTTITQTDGKAEQVDNYFRMNGYNTTNGEFHSKESLKNDAYFHNMNEFIDNQLNLVAEVVSHKKTLKKIKKENHSQIKNLYFENELSKKKNQAIESHLREELVENRDLKYLLAGIRDKLDLCKAAINDTRRNERQQISYLKQVQADHRSDFNG